MKPDYSINFDPNKVKIAKVQNSEEMQAVGKLRYSILIEELGFSFSAADHTNKTLIEPQDQYSTNLFLLYRDDLIAACRSTVLADGEFEFGAEYDLDKWKEQFKPNEIALFSRFVFHKRMRSGGLYKLLCLNEYVRNRSKGVRLAFLDCIPDILDLYVGFGFLPFKGSFFNPNYKAEITPHLFFLQDVELLNKISSPIAPVASEFAADDKARLYFEKVFAPQYVVNTRAVLSGASDPFNIFLNNIELKAFRETLPQRAFKASEVIFQQTEQGDDFFLISAGSLKVEATINGKNELLGTLKEGQFFGEMGAIAGIPRTATVTAITNGELCVFSRSSILKQLEQFPPLAITLLRVVAERLLKNLKVARRVGLPAVPAQPSYKLEPSEIEELLRHFPATELKIGTKLFKAGERGTTVYIVVKGSIEILDAKGDRKDLVEAGGILGELATLTFGTRIAGAATHQNSTLIILTKEQLLSYLQIKPAFVINLIRSIENLSPL